MSEDVFGLEIIEDPEVHELADNADESELMGTEERNLKAAERWAGSIRAAHDLIYCQKQAGNDRGGMAELKTHLIKDRRDEIVQNVLRRLMSYAIGREVTYRDRFVVEELLKRAKDNEYKLQDMIISICQSKALRGQKPKDD